MNKTDQLDRLVQEIEGRINDFETGISDKEETIKSFADFIGKIAANVAKDELSKILSEWADYLESEAYIAIKARLTKIAEL